MCVKRGRARACTCTRQNTALLGRCRPACRLRPAPASSPSPPSFQARWLLSLLQRGPEAARAAFEQIPESVVGDLTAYLGYVIRARGAELLGGVDIGLLMACLAGLLRHVELVPSPKTHYGIVALLLGMLAPQLYGQASFFRVCGFVVWIPGSGV